MKHEIKHETSYNILVLEITKYIDSTNTKQKLIVVLIPVVDMP